MSCPQGGVVVFNPEAFKLRYPEFSGMNDPLANEYFNEATLYLNNTGFSPVRDLNQRTALLNMLTAHIAALNFGINGKPPVGIVGRIDNASEGTVSVHAEMGPASGTSAWFMQTQYGASFWQATAQFRTAHYIPGRSHPARGPFGWPWIGGFRRW